MFERIKQDSRHKSIIKILEKQVDKPPFEGYLTDFITNTEKYSASQLKYYLNYIEVLDPKSQKGLKRVIEVMMV